MGQSVVWDRVYCGTECSVGQTFTSSETHICTRYNNFSSAVETVCLYLLSTQKCSQIPTVFKHARIAAMQRHAVHHVRRLSDINKISVVWTTVHALLRNQVVCLLSYNTLISLQ